MIIVVDSGGSNINSVRFAFDRLGIAIELSADPDRITVADHVLLPGVGAAAAGMSCLQQAEIIDCLSGLRQPTLGICLGMQLLYQHSDEGDTPCLGILPGSVTRLTPAPDLPTPHMGWNQIEVTTPSPLLTGIENGWFYFVHGYAAPVNEVTIAYTEYGTRWCAVASRDNYFATQFHPEKSAGAGAQLLKNFTSL